MKHKRKRKHLESTISPQPAKTSRGERTIQGDPQGEDEILAPTHHYTARDMSYMTSENLSYEDGFHGAETNKLPQCFLHPPSRKRPWHRDVTGCQDFSIASCSRSPSNVGSSHLMTAVSTEKRRAMNVYYMRVLTKRGVAIFGDTDSGTEPPPKRISIAKLTFPERAPPEVTVPHQDAQHFLTNSKGPCDSKAQEWEEAASAAKPLVQEAGANAKTPSRRAELERGFRCMGCCKVFPTLDILLKHVEHSIEEGFSCLTFHLAFARLRRKRKKEERKKLFNSGGWQY